MFIPRFAAICALDSRGLFPNRVCEREQYEATQLPCSQTPFGNTRAQATLLRMRAGFFETEFQKQLRSQTELGSENKLK